MLKPLHKGLVEHASGQNATNLEAPTCPPAYLEYTWYLSLTYAMLGIAWGVVIPAVGGVALALLAGVCFLTVADRVGQVYASAAMGIYTGISMIAIQYCFHNAESFEMSIMFFSWLCSLIVVSVLALRPGFLHRFALVALVIGLCVLPFVGAHKAGGLTRMSAIGTGIANPNALAMWFGFCAVYFIFQGLQAKKPSLRVASWIPAVGCLYVVTSTVSRGALLAIVLACVVGLRTVLKRHFIPLLALVLTMWGVYESGVFQPMIDSYLERGTEETGRGKVWPVALERALDSPWVGVGLDDVKTKSSTMKKHINPHNVLLYMILGGGVVPLICFLGYLHRVAKEAFRLMRMGENKEAAMLPPLTTFGLLEIMATDAAFTTAWVVVVFTVVAMKHTPSFKG